MSLPRGPIPLDTFSREGDPFSAVNQTALWKESLARDSEPSTLEASVAPEIQDVAVDISNAVRVPVLNVIKFLKTHHDLKIIRRRSNDIHFLNEAKQVGFLAKATNGRVFRVLPDDQGNLTITHH